MPHPRAAIAMCNADRHHPQPLPTTHLQPSAGSMRARGGAPARGATTPFNFARDVGDAEGCQRSRELLGGRVLTVIVPAALPEAP
jgi:hypothetical protein